jgi:hypothetical protein
VIFIKEVPLRRHSARQLGADGDPDGATNVQVAEVEKAR